MVARWEQRFANGLDRYSTLSTYNLIGPWSSASLRFCTSELKAQVIGPHLARELRGKTVIQIVGIRREESANRAKTPISKSDDRYAKPGNRSGTKMLIWHPVAEWSTQQVFDFHRSEGLDLHPAYSAGCSRVSCAFCIMQSVKDSEAAASVVGNHALYRHLVELEAKSSFSFWPGRWLSDVAPRLLSPALVTAVERGKSSARERIDAEASMPRDLRYTAGWPPRVPTLEEASRIVAARKKILARHGREDAYPTPSAVVDRFADLVRQRKAKSA